MTIGRAQQWKRAGCWSGLSCSALLSRRSDEPESEQGEANLGGAPRVSDTAQELFSVLQEDPFS